jgi:RNA polymerase sigma factor (sigma-70 family)
MELPKLVNFYNFGFQNELNQLFHKGMSAGTLSIREIASAIPANIKNDKETLLEVLEWILNYLEQMKINVISDAEKAKFAKLSDDEIELEEISIAQTPEEEKSENILGKKMFSLLKLLSEAKRDGKKRRQIILRNKIVKLNLNLSWKISTKYTGRLENEPRELAVEQLDLYQEGALGLMKATGRFNFLHGNRYSTYAYWWIDRYMDRYFCCNGRVVDLPVHRGDDIKRLKKVRDILLRELEREPEREEILQKLGWPQEKFDAVFDALRFDKALLSLDEPLGDNYDGDDSLSLEEMATPDHLFEIANGTDDHFQEKIEKEIY